MSYKDKIKVLVKVSKKVISDCALPGGGIVAANSSMPYYSKEAKNYRYIWPRDASFISYAASILNMNLHELFFKWCAKTENWSKTGLFYEKYSTSGKKISGNFQPDQTGTILWSIFEYLRRLDFNENSMHAYKFFVSKCADGLCKIWNHKCFTLVSQDLWEERNCFPDLEENFTYSLAACAKGLQCAYELFYNEKWLEVSEEMRDCILNNAETKFIRSFGKMRDDRIDASLLGLVWPFELVPSHHALMVETIHRMEDTIIKNYGVYRYEQDEYDGWMYKKNTHRRKGAGYWPLLNFWMSIYYSAFGEEEKALNYYNKVLNDISHNYIPEQIFNNSIQVAVSPLAWSHAMFVIATEKLGLLPL